jgi:hypothetical protein
MLADISTMNFSSDAEIKISADKLKNGLRVNRFPKKNMALIFDVMVNKLFGQEG